MTAFNTDGFDVHGNNVWIHDVDIWAQDDTIAVKGGTNMLFERINASGIGLTIGSVGADPVQNITFRDCHMHNTYKGIYMKFRSSGLLIKDVTYENIVIDGVSNTPIWIGPA
jgi:rhamnogalacturonan hydrolase